MADKPSLCHLGLRDENDLKLDESTSGQIHFCDICGKRGRWNLRWSWFGSYLDYDAEVILKLCGCTSLTEADGKRLLAEKRTGMGLRPTAKRHRY